MSTRSPRPRVWPAPIALGLITAFGLIAALLSDGIGDVLAWVALAVPVAVVTRYSWRRRLAASGAPGVCQISRGTFR